MPDIQHPLERRASKLAGAITSKIDLIVNAVAPPGSRPPFTQQLSKKAALAFWTEHRYDSVGREILVKMKPEAIMELDLALANAKNAEQGLTEEWEQD